MSVFMMIANTRFWLDGACLRSSNRKTGDQPFEAGLRRRWGMPGFKVYEDEAERGGTEVRLAVEFLWFWVNTLVLYSKRDVKRWDDSCRTWGFYFMDRVNFVWRWGKLYWSFDLPFITTVHVKQEILSLSRRRVAYLCRKNFIEDYDAREKAKAENTGTFKYTYTCLDGERQVVDAKVTVERNTRRYKWTPFKTSDDSIWVNFSDEVGPGKGSWKGGVTGCGYALLPNEPVPQCLHRMELERRFER